MPTTTAPQLTDEQKKQYNSYRAEGLTPEKALSLATKDSDNQYNPGLDKGVNNILFGQGSLTEAVGKGIKDAAYSGFKEVYDDTQKYGAGFALLKSPLSVVAGVGRGVGDVIGGALETADQLTDNKVSGFLKPVVESAVNSDVGQYLLQKGQELDQKGRGIPSDILDASNLLGLGALVKSGTATSIRDAVVNATKGVLDRIPEPPGGGSGGGLADFIARNTKKTVDEAKTPLDQAVTDVASGKTTENINPAQKAFVDENNLLTPAEKRRLLQVDPAEGNRYIEALKASEADDTEPSIFDVAVNDTLDVVKKYKAETSAVGSEIGKIKQKLTELPVDNEAVSSIKTDLVDSLAKKNVVIGEDGKFMLAEGKNSPFSAADVKVLNEDVFGALQNIENSGDMNELLLAMESLDSKINFSRDANVSSSLQGVSKTIRGKLKSVRDSALSPEEAKAFAAYSNAIDFTDEFLKSDSKISTLLNRLGTKHSRDSLSFVNELKRVTGIDVQNYSSLARILTEATVGSGRNKSLLQQHMINAGLDVKKLTSPSGIIDTVIGGTIRSVLDVNKLKEIEKAINTVVPAAKP